MAFLSSRSRRPVEPSRVVLKQRLDLRLVVVVHVLQEAHVNDDVWE
jgi:hypothetical protein